MAKDTLKPSPREAPDDLSDRSKAMYSQVADKVKKPGRWLMLVEALRALDRAEDARQRVAIDGMTATTEKTGAVHVHPLVKVEMESRRQFATLWQALGLHNDFSVYGS